LRICNPTYKFTSIANAKVRVLTNLFKGDFEVHNCLPPQNFIPSTKLHLTTEPPIYCRRCYSLAFLPVVGYNHFYVVYFCHLSSAFLSGLCVGCFNFFRSVGFFLKTIFVLRWLCKLY